MSQNTKNFQRPGGAEWVIGGKLTILEGAQVNLGTTLVTALNTDTIATLTTADITTLHTVDLSSLTTAPVASLTTADIATLQTCVNGLVTAVQTLNDNNTALSGLLHTLKLTE